MSLLKTLKKRYDIKSTRWGEFFVGPRLDAPIPPNSLILCPYCGEFVAFTTEEIPYDIKINRTAYRKYRYAFTSISGEEIFEKPRSYNAGWLICPCCRRNPHHNNAEVTYLPVGPTCLLMALNHRSQDEHAR
jgi:hypothetical protein